jgi:hypothetical protein
MDYPRVAVSEGAEESPYAPYLGEFHSVICDHRRLKGSSSERSRIVFDDIQFDTAGLGWFILAHAAENAQISDRAFSKWNKPSNELLMDHRGSFTDCPTDRYVYSGGESKGSYKRISTSCSLTYTSRLY